MDTSQALTDIAEELDEFGEFETDTGSYLEKLFLRAAREIWNAHAWTFRITSSTITTTDGTEEYTLPSDFESMVNEERLSAAYMYDKFSQAIIPDGDYQIMYGVLLDRGQNKLVFRGNPGAGSFTFYYLKDTPNVIGDLASIPDRFVDMFIEKTKSLALLNSEATANHGTLFEQKAEKLIKKQWNKERAGHTLQDVREPRDAIGDQQYISHTGEEDENLRFW